MYSLLVVKVKKEKMGLGGGGWLEKGGGVSLRGWLFLFKHTVTERCAPLPPPLHTLCNFLSLFHNGYSPSHTSSFAPLLYLCDGEGRGNRPGLLTLTPISPLPWLVYFRLVSLYQMPHAHLIIQFRFLFSFLTLSLSANPTLI